MRNGFNWEKKEESQQIIISNPNITTTSNISNERETTQRNNQTNFNERGTKQVERETIFRYTYMFPAPQQDLSRESSSKKTKFVLKNYAHPVMIYLYF